MFWNDIKDIRAWVSTISAGVNELCMKVEGIAQQQTEHEDNEQWDLERIHDKLNSLLSDKNRLTQVALAEKTLDKFDDYMKNVDKLNSMINEFKGCVSLARAALEERKDIEKQTGEMKRFVEMSTEIHKSMSEFIHASQKIKHEAHFKIDYIYRKIEEFDEILQKKR